MYTLLCHLGNILKKHHFKKRHKKHIFVLFVKYIFHLAYVLQDFNNTIFTLYHIQWNTFSRIIFICKTTNAFMSMLLSNTVFQDIPLTFLCRSITTSQNQMLEIILYIHLHKFSVHSPTIFSKSKFEHWFKKVNNGVIEMILRNTKC